MAYTFSTELFSDFHKDAYGFRPRMDDTFYRSDDQEKQAIWNTTQEDLDRRNQAEINAADAAIETFKFEMFSRENFDVGGKTTEEILAQMVDLDTLENTQDIEHWVWNKGFLFTCFGKDLIKTLTEMKGFNSNKVK